MDFLATSVRQAAALQDTARRPWPLPGGGWRFAHTFEDVLIAHWRVPAERLRPLLPGGLELEERDGSAWLGLLGFTSRDLRAQGTLPVPGVSYPQLNVRTYVRAGGRPGVWFLGQSVGSRVAAGAARRLFGLPVRHARMTLRRGARIELTSARTGSDGRPVVFSARYGPTGPVFEAAPGSLEEFLVERFCLYVEAGGKLLRGEIHHRPWALQKAEAEIELNTMAPPGIELAAGPNLVHYTARQDVLAWPLRPAQ